MKNAELVRSTKKPLCTFGTSLIALSAVFCLLAFGDNKPSEEGCPARFELDLAAAREASIDSAVRYYEDYAPRVYSRGGKAIQQVREVVAEILEHSSPFGGIVDFSAAISKPSKPLALFERTALVPILFQWACEPAVGLVRRSSLEADLPFLRGARGRWGTR